MEARLRDVFDALVPIPSEEWAEFWPHVRERHFPTGAYVYREHHAAPDVHYIISGMVRLYHNGDGVEYVRGFDFEGRFIAAYESVVTGRPSQINMQALEPVHALAFPGSLLLQLYDRHWCWERFGRKILEQLWFKRQDKEMRFRLFTPEEHYRLLIQRKSPLIGRVPLRQLASYLQITPETLSRIRARVKRNPGRHVPDPAATA
ncbi:MAG: Crp/Fnr family transcriptional regulator [Gemmatimonadota bacterium]